MQMDSDTFHRLETRTSSTLYDHDDRLKNTNQHRQEEDNTIYDTTRQGDRQI